MLTGNEQRQWVVSHNQGRLVLIELGGSQHDGDFSSMALQLLSEFDIGDRDKVLGLADAKGTRWKEKHGNQASVPNEAL